MPKPENGEVPAATLNVPAKKSLSAPAVVAIEPTPNCDPPPAMISDCPLTSELSEPPLPNAGSMRVPDTPPVFLNVPLLVIAFAGAVPPRTPLPVALKTKSLISDEPLISCRECAVPSQLNV